MWLSGSPGSSSMRCAAKALARPVPRYDTLAPATLLSAPATSRQLPVSKTRSSAPTAYGHLRMQCQVRWQHSNDGPHKEYFQTPGQAPKPDLSPYERAYPSHTSPTDHPSRFHNSPPGATASFAQEPPIITKPNSLIRRALRSTLWIILFGSLGLASGTGLITFEYLSPLFTEGSAEEAELLEDIRDTIEDHPLVEGLRKDQWREVDLDPATNPGATNLLTGGASKGRSMIYQSLSGSKGLVGLKMFHNASHEYSVMIFFTGFGIEGWPDVVHGGIVTSMLEEGVERHLEYYYGSDNKLDRKGDTNVSVDFKMPVKPGEMYAVLVPPATRIEAHPGLSMPPSMALNSTSDRLLIMPLLMQIGGAPVIEVKQGPVTEYTIKIPSGGAIGDAHIHAAARVTMRIASQRDSGSILDSVGQANASIIGMKRETSSDPNN